MIKQKLTRWIWIIVSMILMSCCFFVTACTSDRASGDLNIDITIDYGEGENQQNDGSDETEEEGEGQQGGMTVDDLISQGYVHRVTFDLQGGTSNGRSELVQYVQDGSFVLEPGSTSDADDAPVREGYTFNAFYLNTEGTGQPWDFENDRVTQDITLYARWLANYTIILHYGENFAQTMSVDIAQNSEGVVQPLTEVSIAGYTITACYLSQEDALNHTNPIIISTDNPYTPTGLSQDNTTLHMWVDATQD